MNEEKILISVIIPIYNVKDYMEKCIESVINQIYTNLEIILIDDGSTDGSADICDKYARLDHRVKVIHKANGGVMSARKQGALIATGEYIINVDGDDWIEKRWIAEGVQAIKNKHIDLLFMQGLIRDYEKVCVKDKIEVCIGTFMEEEIIDYFIPNMIKQGDYCERGVSSSIVLAMIERKLFQEAILNTSEDVKYGDDGMMVYLLVDRAKKIRVIENYGYHYVKHAGSLMDVYVKHPLNDEYIMYYYKYVVQHFQNEKRKKALIHSFNLFMAEMAVFSGFDKLQKDDSDHLIPYAVVKKGTKIIIYGAGNVGENLMNAINDEYELIAVADSYRYGEIINGKRIINIDEIVNYRFDYIVVAVISASTAREIRKQLVEKGIPYEKIAIMQTGDIPEIFSTLEQ